MTIPECRAIHDLCVAEAWNEAGNRVLTLLGKESQELNPKQALGLLRGLFQHLLDNDLYLHAASLQWGGDVFQTEPESVQRPFKAIQEHDLLLVMGGSSLGKSYSVGAWMLLDYLRDPYFTSVKLAAVSEKHLSENLFPHLVRMWRSLAIPLPYDIEVRESSMWLGIREAGYEFGISGLAFKQSQETSGQFKGYKFRPVRKSPHPKFGYFSRLRVLLDEGQNVPGGPYQDFNSLKASMGSAGRVKLVVAFNPENTTCTAVRMAEPEQGWVADDLDKLYDYDSKHGWRVCRLDGAICENVKQRKEVYPGLLTFDGFMSYLKGGGDTSASYYCFGRGFPPIGGTVNTIIPPAWPQEARGEAVFIETPITLGSVDLAFMGKDSAQMAIGRWGLASGYRKQDGTFVTFKDRLNVKLEKPRHVLQIDQILPLQKHDDTVVMSEEIIGRCNMLEIKPEWLAVDKTGIGFGVWSHLNKVWGNCYGIAWNEKASTGKILAEDRESADMQCDGIMSEMWWCFRKWLDPRVCAIIINPIIPPSPLHTQLTSRRYRTGKGGKIKAESKDEYRSRNQLSPDEADSCIMMTQLVRKNSGIVPGLVEHQIPSKPSDPEAIVFREVKHVDFSAGTESICADGDDEEVSISTEEQ